LFVEPPLGQIRTGGLRLICPPQVRGVEGSGALQQLQATLIGLAAPLIFRRGLLIAHRDSEALGERLDRIWE
jgi:hypothetical protein